MRLTKDVVIKQCNEISQASGHLVSFREGESEGYVVLVNDVAVFRGTLRACHTFLSGAACFLNCGVRTTVETTRNFKQLGNTRVANRFRSFNKFYIKARKTAKDTYFSQQFNKYYITIMEVTDTYFCFLCEVRSITPSGIPDGSVNEATGELTVKLEPNDTMDSVALKMLKVIDEEVFKIMLKSSGRVYSHDALLWITPERRKRLGWSNGKLDTVNVEYKIGNY